MAERFDKHIFAESAEAVYASAREMCEAHGGYEAEHDYITIF